MRTKTKQFFLALASSDYDVIALSETWLQDDIVDAELSSNYNLFRQDRNELTSDRSRGGGVLIAVKKAHDFTCTRVLSAGYEHLEQVAVRIKARNHTVYVCCIYIRPNSPPDVYTSHGTAVQELVDLSSNDDSIIVTGDYNLPHLAWTFDVDVNGFIPLNASTEQELALTENVVATGLLQICSLANVNGRILDLAFVNDTLSVELIEPPKPILRTDRHHKPFILRVDFPDIPGVATRIEDAEPDFSRCDFDRVTESLSSIDWDDILQDQDSNTSTTIFYDVLYEIVRQFVPSKRVSRNRTEKLPWWNADLRNRRNILRKARKRLFKAGTPENQTAVDRLEIEYELLQDSLFRDYLNRVQVDLKDNPSSFWKYVRSRKRTSVLPTRISLNGSTAENPEDAANVFADFFSSVYEADAPSASNDYLNDLPTYDIDFPQPEFSQAEVKSALDAVDPSKGAGPDRLPPSFIKRLSEHLAKPVSVIFNRSLSEGTFPDEWKLAAITPIHKTGSTTAAENYRPISILSCLPKVFEVLIHEGMYSAAQDQVVQHNSKTGVIMSSTALALQAVTRHQAGNYTCIASNVEGDGASNTVDLKVMYKPICRPDQKKIYGVARNEAAEILCQVDAYPPPESFKWSFNNTAETIDMPQSGYRVHAEQASSLTYTPVKELDYGTIMCWADNAVGQQREPCVFHLIAAGKPEMPYNCSLTNQTSNSLEVDCAEGFDGGQRQWFVMEIYDQQTHAIMANATSRIPIFNVGGLDSGRLLKIVIYATNMRGRSEAILMNAYTLKPAEKQT
ncbi:hypothetical protein pipiens_006234, partial [Culex pipiens pipiens]